MSNSTKSFLRLSNATGIRRFGEHLTWIQEPDIFHMRLVGVLEGSEFKSIVEWQTEWGRSKSRIFVICDVTLLQSISRDARKLANEHGHIMPTNAITITFGASFGIRVMAEMASRARKVLGMVELTNGVFVDTQADALAELERRRLLG
jgi:hypothetical protein